jgi:hypothetical protein
MSFLLETLTENLKKTGIKSFIYTFKYFPAVIVSKNDLVTRKGVCPYDYIDSFSKFNEICLPTKVQFYSQLNASHISDGDYEHAKNVWSKFNCEILRDYLDCISRLMYYCKLMYLKHLEIFV